MIHGRSLNLLVAEDNSINRILMEKALTTIGHAVTLAGNGIEAVNVAGRYPFDVILMDIEMPEMNGEQAAQRIREILGAEAPAIVALTAHAGEGQREHYLSLGFDAYQAKPIDFDALERLLIELTDGPGRKASTAAARPPAAVEEAASPAIDRSRIDVLRQALEGPVVATMIDKFADGLDNALEEFRDALKAGDLRASARTAHTIKGMSLNFGANLLADKALVLEQLLSAGGRPSEAELQALDEIVDRTRSEALGLTADLREYSA